MKMKITTFAQHLQEKETTKRKLQNESVVIDAHNFFFLTYEISGLSYELGCHCDSYAAYLKDYLSMFRKANIKCYFVFSGGWQNMEKKLVRKPQKGNLKRPIFTKNVIMEVIKENNFEYVVCEYESKKDIIELAQTLKCPIISFDMEFCYAGHPHIFTPTLKFNETDNTIECRVFNLQNFLNKHMLTADKMALFLVLTDENIYPKDFFADFFKHILQGKNSGYAKKHLSLLEWLSKNDKNKIRNTIFKFLKDDYRNSFLNEENTARLFINRHERGGFGAALLLDPGMAHVKRPDPHWFAKGVAVGHVDQEYVNLYRNKHFYGSKALADKEKNDAMILSLKIVKYAFDLLTNFQNDDFSLDYETRLGKKSMVVGSEYSISKPDYEAEVCVFENGWAAVRELGLLEHFARSELQLESLRRVWRAPARARLPLLALAYCARRAREPAATAALPAAVLLTHVMLDVVADNNNNLPEPPFEMKPILDSTTDRNEVTESDCGIAAAKMKGYFKVGTEEIDVRLLHSLVEFQLCLAQLSALNELCGQELPPAVFARTYNGPLAYSLLRAAEAGQDLVAFLDELLSPAPTVYAYFKGLLEVYEDLLFVEAHEGF